MCVNVLRYGYRGQRTTELPLYHVGLRNQVQVFECCVKYLLSHITGPLKNMYFLVFISTLILNTTD